MERVWNILNDTAQTEKLLCFPQLNKWQQQASETRVCWVCYCLKCFSHVLENPFRGQFFSLPISCISLMFTISGNKFDHSDQLMRGIMMNNIDTFFSLCQAIILLPVFIMLKNFSVYNIPGFSPVCPYSVNVHTFNLEIKFDIF